MELKSGHGDSGPAWIGRASTSKTGATVYFNGQAFKSLKGSGIGANYFDVETGDQYWISGIKKDDQDRHWAGGGKIEIDRTVIDVYLRETGRKVLPSNLIPADLAPSEPSESLLEHEHDRAPYDTFERPVSRHDSVVIKRKG